MHSGATNGYPAQELTSPGCESPRNWLANAGIRMTVPRQAPCGFAFFLGFPNRDSLATPSRLIVLNSQGVGYPRNHSSTSHLRRKALTWFRESATPCTQRRDFSPPFPRPYPSTVANRVNTEVPFLRHFSATAGGIKTYPPGKKKNAFRRCGLGQYWLRSCRSVVPKVHRWTQDLVFDSDLKTMCS